MGIPAHNGCWQIVREFIFKGKMKWKYILLIIGAITLIVGGLVMNKQGISIQGLLGIGLPGVTAQSGIGEPNTNTYEKEVIAVSSQNYLDDYFTFTFNKVDNTTWRGILNVNPSFLIDIKACVGKNINNACWDNLITKYFSTPEYNGYTKQELKLEIEGMANYPLKNMTAGWKFSNFSFNLNSGTANFDITFPNGFSLNETAKFGFNSTLTWTTSGIITFDDDDGAPATYVAEILNTGAQKPSFVGTLTTVAIKVVVSTGTSVDAGEGLNVSHCETSTCASIYVIGSITGTSLNTPGTFWVNSTDAGLLARIEHDGADSEFLNVTESYDGLDGGENLNFVASVFLVYDDSTNPVVHLVSPTNATSSSNLNQTFSANITDTNQVNSLSLYIWNSSGSLANYYLFTPNIWTDLSATDTGNWMSIDTIYGVSVSPIDNLVYTVANSGKFGVYNKTSNIWTDLSATDTGNWMSTTIIYGVSVSPIDGLVYTVANSGKFGVYNKTSNIWTDLSATDTGDWMSTAAVRGVSVSPIDGLVYTGASSGKFGVYNKTSNIWTDLSATDTGDWMSTTLVFGVSVSPINGLVYTVADSGKFGVYNSTSNIWTDLSTTDTGNWMSIDTIYGVSVSPIDNLVYTVAYSGKFGVYNKTSNIWTDLSATDTGDWMADTIIHGVSVSPIDGLVYTGASSEKLGVYNKTSNIWTDLSATDTGDWMADTNIYGVSVSPIDGLVYTIGNSGKLGVYNSFIVYVSGISDSGTWNFTFPSEGTYYWNAYGCDIASNCVFSNEGNYTITISTSDTIAPQWSSNSTNSTVVGTLVNHTVLWSDTALSNFTFSFDNGTGVFVNDSSVSMTGTSNQSWSVQIVNQTVGSYIRWRVQAWDLTGNNNLTSIFAYNTTIASANCWTYNSPTKYLQIPTGCLYTGNLTA